MIVTRRRNGFGDLAPDVAAMMGVYDSSYVSPSFGVNVPGAVQGYASTAIDSTQQALPGYTTGSSPSSSSTSLSTQSLTAWLQKNQGIVFVGAAVLLLFAAMSGGRR
jgi:hypothetical protein